MEDWEKHFVEKSRRRADKDRTDRKRRRRTNQIGLAFAIAVLLGSIIALTVVERGHL